MLGRSSHQSQILSWNKTKDKICHHWSCQGVCHRPNWKIRWAIFFSVSSLYYYIYDLLDLIFFQKEKNYKHPILCYLWFHICIKIFYSYLHFVVWYKDSACLLFKIIFAQWLILYLLNTEYLMNFNSVSPDEFSPVKTKNIFNIA